MNKKILLSLIALSFIGNQSFASSEDNTKNETKIKIINKNLTQLKKEKKLISDDFLKNRKEMRDLSRTEKTDDVIEKINKLKKDNRKLQFKKMKLSKKIKELENVLLSDNLLKRYVIQENKKIIVKKDVLKNPILEQKLHSKKSSNIKNKINIDDESKKLAEEKAKAEAEAEAEAKRLAEEKKKQELAKKKMQEKIALIKKKAEEDEKRKIAEMKRLEAEKIKKEKEELRIKLAKIKLEKAKAEAEAKRLAEEKAKAEAEAKRLAEEKAKAEEKTRKMREAKALKLAAEREVLMKKQKALIEKQKERKLKKIRSLRYEDDTDYSDLSGEDISKALGIDAKSKTNRQWALVFGNSFKERKYKINRLDFNSKSKLRKYLISNSAK